MYLLKLKSLISSPPQKNILSRDKISFDGGGKYFCPSVKIIARN
jgi:hypothetical protein